MTETVILIGFMGAGKTTVGHALAQISGQAMIDLDDEFTREVGLSPKCFLEQNGEESFRDVETSILKKHINSSAIISTGGGVVESAANRQLIRDSGAPVVYLQTDLAHILARLTNDSVRPMLRNMSVIDLQNCWERRGVFYRELASLTIETTNKEPLRIAQEILTFNQNQDNLIPLRSKIDSIDRQIFDLISQRFDVVREVAAFKKLNNVSVVQNGRMDKMRTELKEDFEHDENITDELIENTMNLLFTNSIQRENSQIKKSTN